MSDDADFAAELVAAEIAAGLARIDRAIPVGAPGECDECGEVMPRLVGGRCGYCRDGRRPPLSRFDAPVPASPQPAKEPPVANSKPTETYRAITIQARDEVLAAIQSQADERGTALPAATLYLVGIGIEALGYEKAEPAPSGTQLADLSVEELLDEVRRRIEGIDSAAELEEELADANRAGAAEKARADAAEQRAEQADARFAKLRAALDEVA